MVSADRIAHSIQEAIATIFIQPRPLTVRIDFQKVENTVIATQKIESSEIQFNERHETTDGLFFLNGKVARTPR